ncbi:MAG: hypothetical protein M1822_006083 [Bathelium mastoideum]|nr:MAG: hypothetical protein M1822_006083 [Bathelium mastoideum]
MLDTCHWQRSVPWLLLPALLCPSTSAASINCASEAIKSPELPGISVINLSASPTFNYSISIQAIGPATNLSNLNFCNVTVTYTHPGENDTVNTQVWLPLSGWNGRLQGTGGGGFSTGIGPGMLAPAVQQGFAAANTDGGHDPTNYFSAASWAWVSPHNVNEYLLQDFAGVSLHEMAIIAKQVVESAYGTKPKYSYWNGCSTGGRQGLMMAQRYPKDYDGILALAPAINWDSMGVGEYYSQFIMNQLNYYPPRCELDAITAAAIGACDGLDGVVDGVISLPNECHFSPYSVVGKSFSCNGANATISHNAATVVNAAWGGARNSNGSFLWYGLHQDAPLALPNNAALATTTCTTTAETNCTGAPFGPDPDWIRYFVLNDVDFDITKISHADYDWIMHLSRNRYGTIMGTADPDLSFFRAAGGKMITWHGLADQLIFPNGTVDYYKRVLERDPQAQDFYRFFEAPGTVHCAVGAGPYPETALESLMQWVEAGMTPETLATVGTNANGTEVRRNICPWPQVQTYVGGDPNVASSFVCR